MAGPLGAGGVGEVYSALDTRLGPQVAVKILPAGVAGDPSRRQRFDQEARAVAALNHPNIVAVYDIGEGYFVTELVDGASLRGLQPGVRRSGSLSRWRQRRSGFHGKFLVVMATDPAGTRISRIGLDGSPAREIAVQGDLRPTPYVGPRAVRLESDSWY